MGTTPLHSYPYPEGTDQPYVHLDIQALAAAVDADTTISQEAAPAHRVGRQWFRPSTKVLAVSDGSNWTHTPIEPVYQPNYRGMTNGNDQLKFWKTNGKVEFEGSFENALDIGSWNINVQYMIGLLPVGWRPAWTITRTAVYNLSGVGFGSFNVRVESDGRVTWQPPSSNTTSFAAGQIVMSVGRSGYTPVG